MSDPSPKKITPRDSGFFDNLTVQIKLILRLLADRRVSPLLKLLPIGALVYMIVPDIAIGPIDDALVIWLGSALFIELCPQEIVKEHRDALTSVVEGEWREVEENEKVDSDQGSLPNG
ncbi:MAG: hypothetical protein AMJ88_01720 [Anaerolineae bacterium SM23_ 63]|nr:MAG: hypothetical protein AMJ88_01720 [Anaerolineae bacterium SM23_ 63]HEY47811.1 hypothetical protein [Anaerolineae bacterium]